MFRLYNIKNLFILFFPIFLSITLQNISLTIDSIMVNRYVGYGAEAIGVASSLINIIGPIFFAIASGINIYYVQYFALQKKEELKQLTGIGIYSILTVSFLAMFLFFFIENSIFHNLIGNNSILFDATINYFTIFKFVIFLTPFELLFNNQFRVLKKPKLALYLSCIQIIVNIIFNAILIFGYGDIQAMGLQGAAIATLLSKVVFLVMAFVLLKHLNSPFLGKMNEMLNVNKSLFIKVIKNTIPLLLVETMYGFSKFFITKIFLLTGVLGYQAYIIANRITMTFNGLVIAPAQIAGIIIGETITSQDNNLINKQLNILKQFLFIIGIILSFAIIFISPILLKIFNVTDFSVLNIIKILIILNGIYMILRINVASNISILKAGGDNRFIILLDSGITILFILPIMYFLAKNGCSPIILCIIMIIDMIIKIALGQLRLKTNKWKNLL